MRIPRIAGNAAKKSAPADGPGGMHAEHRPASDFLVVVELGMKRFPGYRAEVDLRWQAVAWTVRQPRTDPASMCRIGRLRLLTLINSG